LSFHEDEEPFDVLDYLGSWLASCEDPWFRNVVGDNTVLISTAVLDYADWRLEPISDAGDIEALRKKDLATLDSAINAINSDVTDNGFAIWRMAPRWHQVTMDPRALKNQFQLFCFGAGEREITPK
jgi:hypothetical protein